MTERASSYGRKPHISPSQLDMYLRCGEQWRRRYVLKEVIPPGIALIKGGAVHKAAEVNFGQKIESHEDLPVATLCEAAAEHVDATVSKDGLFLAPDDPPMDVALGQAKDSAVSMTKVFAGAIAPRIQPALVERFVTIPLPAHSHDLLGRLDCATDHDEVIDLKTSGKRKSQDDVDRSDQLTFYDAAFQYETGRPCKGVRLEVVVETKTPTAQTLRRVRGARDREILLAKINTMLAGVAAGVFLPAAPGSWCCSPRYCGYAMTCPFFDSERKAAAEAVFSGM